MVKEIILRDEKTRRNAMKVSQVFDRPLRVKTVGMLFLAAIMLQGAAPSNAQDFGSALSNTFGSISDGLKGGIDSVQGIVDEGIDTLEKGAENLQESFDQAVDCAENIDGCITNIAVDGAKSAYEASKNALARGANSLAETLGVEELRTVGDCLDMFGDQFCTTDEVREEFASDTWTPYYGERLWDSQAAATVLASIFPPTSAYGIQQLQQVLEGQADSLIDILETAARDIGSSADSLIERIIVTLLNSGSFDDVFGDVGIKAALLRVNCRNDWCIGEANGEGYYQIAFAWRLFK